MDRGKKIRVWIGVAHIAFALLLFALFFFVFGVEVNKFPRASGEEINYGGFLIGLVYIFLCLGDFICGLHCLRIAAHWIFSTGAKVIDRAIVVKFGVCFPLVLHALLSPWWVGRAAYIGLIVLFATAAILELIFIERLRILSSPPER